MVKRVPLINLDAGKKDNHVRFFKAEVMESHLGEDINKVVKEFLNKSCSVFTDKSSSYVDSYKFVELHITEKSATTTIK